MNRVTNLVFLMGCCALAGCATQAPATSAGSAASTSALSANTNSTTQGTAAATDEKPIPYGYTRTVVNGVEKFCRVDTYTGSRTQKSSVCLTRVQLDQMQSNSSDFIQDVQRRSGTSTQNTTPGAGGAMGGH